MMVSGRSLGVAVALAALAGAPTAGAQEPGWYTPSEPAVSLDNEPALTGGYQFGSHFALEFEYLQPGDTRRWVDETRDQTLLLDPIRPFEPEPSLRPDGLGVSAVGILPIARGFEAYGKAGLFSHGDPLDFGRNRTRVGGYALPGFVDPASEDRPELTLGAGMRYDFGERLGLRFDWERFGDPFESSDRDLLGIGIDYRLK